MRAHTVIHAASDGRRTIAERLRSEAPLIARTSPAGSGALTVHFVGGAAGPLGGDELRTDIVVGAHARVLVRSVAASIAQPGAHGGASVARVAARIEAGGILHWRPEPMISVAGSDHRVETTLDACSGADVVWMDEIVLGRHGEAPGRVAARLRLTIDGRVVLDHEVVAGDRPLAGPGVNGPFRVLASAVVVRPGGVPPCAPTITPTCRAAALDVADGVTLLTGVATTLDEVRRVFALGEPACLGVPAAVAV